jgi:hypothetical protein
MALASFPAACSPTHDESSAIAYLCVDKQGARHFLEVAWHTNSTQRYLFEATPAFAQSLQSVIRSVNQAHAQRKRWSGPGSLGKVIDMARKEGRLGELTHSQCAEYYARTHADRDADFGTHEQTFSTPISGRATNQEPENLHTDDAVATRPSPTPIRIDFRVPDYLIDSEGMLMLEEIANTQIIKGSQTLSATSTLSVTSQPEATAPVDDLTDAPSMSPGISQPSTAQAVVEPGPLADASAGDGRQSLDDGTSQSDCEEACSSQSMHGERVNSQEVSPAGEDKGKGKAEEGQDKGKGKAEEGQDTYGKGGSSGRGGGRGEGNCRHGKQLGKCRECRGGEGEAAGGEGRGREEPETQRREKRAGAPADASAGYVRQSSDNGTSQSDRQEACTSQSIHGERVNFQKVFPAGSQASGGVDSDSDSDSDDEDPGVKWRRNMDARLEKRVSERERRKSEERARETRTTPARVSSVQDCNTSTGSGSANDDAASHRSSPSHRGASGTKPTVTIAERMAQMRKGRMM